MRHDELIQSYGAFTCSAKNVRCEYERAYAVILFKSIFLNARMNYNKFPGLFPKPWGIKKKNIFHDFSPGFP